MTPLAKLLDAYEENLKEIGMTEETGYFLYKDKVMAMLHRRRRRIRKIIEARMK